MTSAVMERDESMSDYIKREDAVERIKIDCDRFGHVPKRVVKFFTLGMESVPSADVVEVVRCKDCKHWQKNTEFCSKFSTLSVTHRMPPWAFCCLGERKEQGDE